METKQVINEVKNITRFQQARESAGLSVGQIAKLTELSRETILKYDSGETSINFNPILKNYFISLFKVSPEWLEGQDIVLSETSHNALQSIKHKLTDAEFLKMVEFMKMTQRN